MTDSTLVFLLNKSLYGLKQAPRAWYENIDWFFVNLVFKCCEFDHSIYVLRVQGDTLTISIYVDDFVLSDNKPDLIFRLNNRLANTFEMT